VVAGRSWPDKTEARIVSVVQTLAPVASALEANTFAQEPAFTVIAEADESERDRLKTVVKESADLLRRAGLTVASTVVDGFPGEAILSISDSWKADAIFIGARGLGRVERFLLGSVSTHVVTRARCTVEVVRQAS
jgi:nucleotide-binding universal stress UspA family protein